MTSANRAAAGFSVLLLSVASFFSIDAQTHGLNASRSERVGADQRGSAGAGLSQVAPAGRYLALPLAQRRGPGRERRLLRYGPLPVSGSVREVG